MARLERRFGRVPAVVVWYLATFGVLLGLTILVGTVVTALGPETWLGNVDRAVGEGVSSARNSTWTMVMQVVTDLGDSLTIIVAGILAGTAWRLRRGTWAGLGVLAVSFGGALALYRLGKAVVGRQRPGADLALDVVPGLAFPSGHATASSAFYVTLALLVAMVAIAWAVKVWLVAGAVLVALLVAVSRVYLGAHWATDVVAGLVIGTCWALVSVTPLWLRAAQRSASPG